MPSSLSPSVPLALRQIQEGLADLKVAIEDAAHHDECLRIREDMGPLVTIALRLQGRAAVRADELMEGK